MRIYYRCLKCGECNFLPISARSRFEIRESKDKKILTECSNCGIKANTNINDLKAKEGRLIGVVYLLGLVAAMIIGSAILLNYWDDDLGIGLGVLEMFGIGIGIPFIVAGLIVAEHRKAIKIFNDHYV